MNDLDKSLIIVLVAVISLTATSTYFNSVQDEIVQKLDDRVDKSFTNANQHHEDIREDIKVLCSMIDNCELTKP